MNKEKVIIGGCGHAGLPFGKVRDQLKMALFHINNLLNQLLRPQVSKDKRFFNKVGPHNSDLISK